MKKTKSESHYLSSQFVSPESKGIISRSGSIKSKDKFVCFLYILMRDYLPSGDVEEIIQKQISEKESTFCNGWLAEYAKDVAKRLK